MSLGNNSGPQIEEDACWYAYTNGVTVFAAAGNGGNDGIGDSDPHYPAAFPGVRAVANSTKFDIRNDSSNYGSWVDITAPGTGILSTIPNDDYTGFMFSGTSMASPLAAGLAGLILSADPSLPPDEVEMRIKGGADDLSFTNPGFEDMLGAGRVNFHNSVVDSPALRHEKHIVMDGSGNGNNEADHNETVDLSVYIMNHSWQGATSISATLEALNPGVTVTQNSSTFTNLDSKETAMNNTPFQIQVTAADQRQIDLQLNFTAAGGYTDSDIFSLSINNPLPQMPNFPYPSSATYNASPKTCDLDGDGLKEIIIVNNNGLVEVVSADGSEFSGWPIFIGSNEIRDSVVSIGASAIGDLDLDGDMEIVFADYLIDYEYIVPDDPESGREYRVMGRLHAYHHDGTVMPGFPLELPAPFGTDGSGASDIKCSPTIADVRGDEHPEIMFGSYNHIAHVIDWQGNKPDGWPKNLNAHIFASPAVGDLDGDGSVEIVFATKDDVEPLDSGEIYVFDGFGNPKPGFPVAVPNQVYSSPALVDLDMNGTLEIVYGFGDYAEDFDPNGVNALTFQGDSLPGWPVMTQSSVYSPVAIGDLNGDGSPDVVAADKDARVYAYNSDGSLLTGFPVQVAGDEISSSPVIADLDGVGGPEIIVGSSIGNNEGYLAVLYADGTQMANTPIELDSHGFPSACIDDIDGDGDLEILAASKSIYAFNMNTPYQADKQYWPSYQNDNQNTGLYGAGTGMPAGVTVQMNKTMFTGGDPFVLDAFAVNESGGIISDVDLFVILDVYQNYWFYPNWNSSVSWIDIGTWQPGTTHFGIFDFVWPEGDVGSATDLRFWGAVLTSDGQLYGQYDFVTFGYN